MSPYPTPILTPDIVLVPAEYFWSPYWLLNIFFLLALVTGILIGLLAAWGPAEMRTKICTLWLRLTS